MNAVTKLSPAVSESVLDVDALKALEAALGPDECAEMIDDGLLEATDRLVAIEIALEAESWTRVARAARELAAIAPRIGLTDLGRQAEALEDCCQCLDRVSAHAVGQRLLRHGEAALSASLLRPAG